MGEKVNKIY